MPKVSTTSLPFGYAALKPRSLFTVDFSPKSLAPYARPCSVKGLHAWKDAVGAAFLAHPELLDSLTSPTDHLHTILGVISASRSHPCRPSGWIATASGALREVKALQGHSLSSAIAARLSIERTIRLETKHLRANITLYKSPEARVAAYVCATLQVKRLPPGEFYPPRDEYVALSCVMKELWRDPLNQANASDKRNTPRGTHVLVQHRLQLSIPGDLSCVVYDEQTSELILVVVWHFCSIAAVLHAIALVGRGVFGARKNVRLRDPGSLVQVGYTAGSLSSPKFGFARNFKLEGLAFITPIRLAAAYAAWAPNKAC